MRERCDSWMRARVRKCAQGFATAVAMAAAFAVHADYTVIDSAAALALGGATGGDEIRRIDNGDGTIDLIHIFTTTGEVLHLTTPIDTSAIVNARYLAVGGGGSGGSDCGGGGGAGGYVANSLVLGASTTYDIVVGEGGAGWTNNGTNRHGEDGTASAITNATAGTEIVQAFGGGGGATWSDKAGSNGGSGGGSITATASAATQPTSTWGGFGNAGGTGNGGNAGGGGGGAGGAGTAGNATGGTGGAGVENEITGEAIIYAFGGGGRGTSNPGVSGDGISDDGYGDAGTGARDGQPGKPATGAGGGGGGTNPHRKCGAGGSGIVVIRYTVLNILDDGSVLYAFTKTNTVNQLTLPKAALTRILLVGGGGGGASGQAGGTVGGAGGGGAGGFVDTNNVILVGGEYGIYVGAGGAGGSGSVAGGTPAENGRDSAITNATMGVEVLRALGGGRGGVSTQAAGNGGSGGGGSRANNAGGLSTQQSVLGYGVGNAGGNGMGFNQSGAGGGGAGGPGDPVTAANAGSNGGAAAPSDITGESKPRWYAAGGGGGSRGDAAALSSGGAGGMGGDEVEYGGHGGYGDKSSKTEPTKGKDGTGSGGGGGCYGYAGGAGGSGIVYVRIFRYMPDKPVDTNFTYTGAIFAAYAEDSYAEKAYTLEGTYEASAVGNYTFTATLKPGFCWGDGTTAPVVVNWQILPKQLDISSFTMAGWQVGEAPSEPVLVSDPVVLASEVTYYYSASSSDWSAATTDKPTTVGTWFVKPVFDSTNFSTNGIAIPEASFTLWSWDASGKYPTWAAYHVDLTDTRYTGTTPLTNFPVLVRVNKSILPSFYDQCQADGSDVRFTDAAGNVLPFELNEWNPDGESSWWVKVPEYKADSYVATINWGVVLDEDEEGNRMERAMPSNDPTEVWSGYIAVWHLESGSYAVDATGHGYTLSLGSGGSVTAANSSVFGSSTYATGGSTANGALYCADYDVDYPDAASNFTYTAWYYAQGYSGNMNFAGKKPLIGSPDPGGWLLRLESGVSSTVRFITSSGGYYTMSGLPALNANWDFFAVASSGTNFKFYANAAEKLNVTAAAVQIFGNGYPLVLTSRLMAADEVRVAAGQRSADWIKAEYQQANLTGEEATGLTFGTVVVTPDVTLKNAWLTEPALGVETVNEGVDPGLYLSLGTARYGTPVATYLTLGGVEVADITAAAPGSYVVRVSVPAGTEGSRSWPALPPREFAFSILGISPYSGLDDATRNGRVLLVNDDENGDFAIAGQSYYLTDPAGETYWIHANESAVELMNYLGLATRHELRAAVAVEELCGGTRLWYLDHVRIGNTYPDSLAEAANRNFLPWSTTGRSTFDPAETQAGLQKDSANLVLQNVEGAAIYSPCYTNGIGTVYFDAVNGWANTEDGSEYKIVVEYATYATVDGARVLPTDDNAQLVTPAQETEDQDGNPVTLPATTNYFAQITAWQLAPQLVIETDGDGGFASAETVLTNALAVTTGGGHQRFYRVAAKVGVYEPCRFRIRRVSINEAYKENPDASAFILLDNVVVSYPPMMAQVEPEGWLDDAKHGKATLGVENAFLTPFPAVGDEITARATARYITNPGAAAQTEKFIVSARMLYRWRYLDQAFMPADGSWREVLLDRDAGFRATEALTLPEGLVGDVEFRYVLTLNTPYYVFHDYAGYVAGDADGLGGYYTEQIATVTNALAGATQESQGTDWFVRLREGQSAFESLEIATLSEDRATTNDVVRMELSGDHTWRGCYQTKTNAADTAVYFQIRARNEQTAGATGFATNVTCWALNEDVDQVPFPGILEAEGEDRWARLPIDATTGHLLFQVDDRTRSLTIVHADYQNFNAWNDAQQKWFVGTSTYTNSAASGTAAAKMKFAEDFSGWVDMPRTTNDWCVPYLGWTDIQPAHMGNHAANVEFSSDTSGAWDVGPGYWVPQWYDDARANMGVALQMMGQGKGYVQLTSESQLPRGIGTLSLNARLAQAISFEDFAYYDGDVKARMTNYTFTVRAAFDASSCNDFSGKAALSVIAYYRPKVGCYELRVEPVEAANPNATTPGGINRSNRLRMSLHRWRWKADAGKLEDEQLGCYTNNFKIPVISRIDSPVNTSTSGTNPTGYLPLYISVSNDTSGASCIMAGVGRVPLAYNTTIAAAQSGQAFHSLCYRDTSSKFKLTAGTYGVLSTNCKGIFLRPYHYDSPIPFRGNPPADNQINQYSNQTIAFNGTQHECRSDISDDLWVLDPGRMQAYNQDGNQWGVLAVTNAIAQTLTVYASTDVGKSEPKWSVVTNLTVSGFGSASGMTAFNIPLYLTETSMFKLAVGGDQSSARRDVVIDSLRLDAWRGANWENLGLVGESGTRYVPNYMSEMTGSQGHTNFTFSSGWITNETVLLSARRTQPGTPAAIKSPLMDGAAGYGRGTGLGMIAYSYRDAQPNVRLLIQIATNGVSTANIAAINNLDASIWTTVATNDFSTCTDAERAGGVRSVYLGLHGVSGVMRILMDPTVVSGVANEFNPDRFGDIYITGVTCTDEPVLDETSWWGWNLRAVGATGGADTEKRLYLSDLSTSDSDLGMGMALNNSPVYNIYTNEAAAYREHQPFVQSPTFRENLVGEVQFRARKYAYTTADTNATAAATLNADPAYVSLYGARSGSEGTDANWTLLETFAVSNTTYTTYRYKAEPNDTYSAFRLAVRGVEGLSNYMQHGATRPAGAANPVRVLLDEVLVTEAIVARVGFRNVGAFRGYKDSAGRSYVLQDDLWVPNVPSAAEQPLCGEPWGIQCEIFKAQLPDEIDFETMGREPTVRLHYIEGPTPWGYENWVTNAAAKAVTLSRASDTNLVFRSTYQNGANNVLPVVNTPGLVYQYALEVVYYSKESGRPMTNWLDRTSWEKPAWYNQIDYNAQYGDADGTAWSAYCILDSVAPGWAWINEVNLYGRTAASWQNVEADRQFVEIAAPVEASLRGWKVRMLEADDGDDSVITNTIATFGSGDLATTKSSNYAASDMSFHVIAGAKAKTTGALKKTEGTLDGTWSFPIPTTTFNSTTGEILANRPIGIQLVRASGIVEHEIVTIGTNWWANSASYSDAYHPTNTVNFFNDKINGARFFYAGADEKDRGDSMGVFASQGESDSVWTNDYAMTPGRINANQSIGPHPTPNGETIIVYCNLGSAHLRQTVGDTVDSAANQVVYLNKGSTTGLSIQYTTDPWYVLDSVRTGAVAHAFATNSAVSYTAVVGINASNSFTVVGAAAVEPRLQNYGLGGDNAYTEAVVDWLGGGTTLRGPFKNPDSADLYLAEFRSFGGETITNLTLTQMYWLDMDPTDNLLTDPDRSALALYGGMSKAPSETPRNFVTEAVSETETVTRATMTNLTMAVKMWITNENDNAAWAPYTLRGLTPGQTSADADLNLGNWTSVTFKITGLLFNGNTSFSNRTNWGALRWFVFDADSFDENYESVIEIKDPYSTASPGWTYWGTWFRDHGGKGSPNSNIYYFWSLDEKRLPIGVELLKKENRYE